MYRFWSGTYDWFVHIWNKTIARSAEKDLNEFISKNINKPVSVLDHACGTGINIERLKKWNLEVKDYKGIDLSADMMSKAKKKVGWIKNHDFKMADITKYDFTKKYDLIINTWALSHLDNKKDFIERTLKYLNKGGYFVLIFQGEFNKLSPLNWIFYPFERWLNAQLISEKTISSFPKTFLKKRYLGGYVQLLIYKND